MIDICLYVSARYFPIWQTLNNLFIVTNRILYGIHGKQKKRHPPHKNYTSGIHCVERRKKKEKFFFIFLIACWFKIYTHNRQENNPHVKKDQRCFQSTPNPVFWCFFLFYFTYSFCYEERNARKNPCGAHVHIYRYLQ